MDDLYDETDHDIKISDQDKAIIYMNDRLRDIEEDIVLLNKNINNLISNINNITYVLNSIENNKIILN